jgi:hypothetical protein
MKFLAAISKPLALAMLAVLLAPGAWAAGKGKAYAFKGPPDVNSQTQVWSRTALEIFAALHRWVA